MNVYIIGGHLENREQLAQYMEVEKYLMKAGYKIENPYEFMRVLKSEVSLKDYIYISLKMLAESDHVCMLDGWENFMDSNREFGFAAGIAKPVIIVKKDDTEKSFMQQPTLSQMCEDGTYSNKKHVNETTVKKEDQFEGYDVPERLKKTALAIMERFCISGVCDGMYICNRIAATCRNGDGNGHFYSDKITDIPLVARSLQAAYGCNIRKEDIPELEEILATGTLDHDKASAGIKQFIKDCSMEKMKCPEFRINYLDRCIQVSINELLRLMS